MKMCVYKYIYTSLVRGMITDGAKEGRKFRVPRYVHVLRM